MFYQALVIGGLAVPAVGLVAGSADALPRENVCSNAQYYWEIYNASMGVDQSRESYYAEQMQIGDPSRYDEYAAGLRAASDDYVRDRDLRNEQDRIITDNCDTE
jgi:hypothetical protein